MQHMAASATALPALASDTFFSSAAAENPAAPQQEIASRPLFNVRDFGAVGDGRTLVTAAIQSAIDACAKAGGGKVFVPAGNYLTGPLFLRSNLELELHSGAVLLGSRQVSDYPSIEGRWEGLERTVFASLLTGLDLENVAITGNGVLDGQGAIWREAHHETEELRKKMGLTGREPENPAGSPLRWPRPRMINLYRCRNVRISGLLLRDCPSWNVHPVSCENVRIDGLSIVNPRDSANTDGIDPDSCRNVRISDCYISTGDDCIILKSGYKHIPGKPFQPTENVVVTNCVFGEGHCGVGVGSETAGGIRNVAISNCVCEGTRRGLYIKTARGRGSVIENIQAVNFAMRNIENTAVAVNMFYSPADRERSAPLDETTPAIRNIRISDVTVSGAARSIVFEGLPERPIEGLSLRNVAVDSSSNGVLCSQVHGLTLENIEVTCDQGPAMEIADVENLHLERFRSAKPTAPQPAIRLSRIDGALIQGCSAQPGTPALIELRGPENKEISLALNRVPNGGKEVEYTGGAAPDSVSRLR